MPIAHRGNLLGGANLTLEFTAPARDVIGVKITHFKGVKPSGPEFQITEEPVEAIISDEPGALKYRSGNLEASIGTGKQFGSWNIDFTAGEKLLCSSGFRSIAYFQDSDSGRNYVSEQHSLDVGECIYGLGERFTPFVKNGQAVEMWQADGGTGTEQAYKNIPFYLSNRGYGVFVNSPADIDFEIGTERVERVAFSAEGESLQYFIIYGRTPRDILERYTLLTGRPALPPAWSA
jgi:alpha-D-xyloside xylohydrolase